MEWAQSTAQFLRQHRHDARHLRDQGLQRLADEKIIRKARAEERVVLTHDLDFGRIMALSGRHLPSVIGGDWNLASRSTH
jgi:predicted nuclease of predicted toxin-antitoxin system